MDFVTPRWFDTGVQIYLKAGNNLYVSRVNRGDTNPIEAARTVLDSLCYLTANAAPGWGREY
jgi:hypothetical protein